MKVLIIGATGQILMRESLAQGHEVTALARDPSALAAEDHRLRVLQGYALEASSVEAAVAGQDAVLSALGTRSAHPTTLFSESAHNVIGAMNKHGVRRLVCITGIGAGDSKGHVGFLYDRIILPFIVKNVYEDKDRQEEAIEEEDHERGEGEGGAERVLAQSRTAGLSGVARISTSVLLPRSAATPAPNEKSITLMTP